MNYNEYDGNGNKKKFNFSEMINDKTQRSRLILFVYLIVFIILVVLIRLNLSNTKTNYVKNDNEEEKKENVPVEEVSVNNEIDEMFSFIDMNNYLFSYEVNISNSYSVIEGKRVNDKYDFIVNNNDNILYFNGINSYIRAKESADGEYKLVGFPYILVNYFDTKELKKIIESSTLKDNIYEITNKGLGEVVNYKLNDEEKINTIELIKKNNKVTQIVLNISNAVSSYMNDNIEAKVVLKYSDFGLVDDFRVE